MWVAAMACLVAGIGQFTEVTPLGGCPVIGWFVKWYIFLCAWPPLCLFVFGVGGSHVGYRLIQKPDIVSDELGVVWVGHVVAVWRSRMWRGIIRLLK